MRRRSLVMAIVLATIVLYLPSVTFDRTLDDVFQIRAPGERESRTGSSVWTSSYWDQDQGGGLYRPVTSLTYALEGRLGIPLWARHLINVLLHAAVAGMLAHFALALGLGPWDTAVAALVFALHPTHVEVVAGLVGRAELLATLTVMLALSWHLARLRPAETSTVGSTLGWAAGSAVLAFLGAGSKENAWALPLFAVAVHAARRRSLLAGWPAFAGYLLGVGGHLLLRHQVLGGWLNAPTAAVGPFENPLVLLSGWDRLVGGICTAGAFASHLVLPLRLSPDYSGETLSLPGSPLDARFLAGLLILLAPVVLAVAAWRARSSPRAGACLVGAGWIGVSALLTMNVWLTLGTVLADRLLFWPSAGWALLVGAFAGAMRDKALLWGHRARGVAVRALVISLLAAYGIVFVRYLPTWKNNLTLFDAARVVTPLSPRVWSGYGRALSDEGRIEEALAALRRAESLAPDYQRPWAQEAAVLVGVGRFEEARAPLAQALRLHPQDRSSRVNQGILWMWEGKLEEATTRFREVLAQTPDHAVSNRYLALCLQEQGDYQGAALAWRRYLAAVPKDSQALNDLAWILATRLDAAQEAEALARRAVALWPENPNLRDTLAEVLVRLGRRDEAARVAREALDLEVTPELAARLRRFLEPTGPDSSRSEATGAAPSPVGP